MGNHHLDHEFGIQFSANRKRVGRRSANWVNGTVARMRLPSNRISSFYPDGSYTVTGWIYVNSNTSGDIKIICAMWPNAGSNRVFMIRSSSTVKIQHLVSTNGSSSTTVEHGTSFSSHVGWLFFDAGFDGVSEKAWVNVNRGTKVESAALSVSQLYQSSNTDFVLGNWSDKTTTFANAWVNHMDDIAFWHRVLSDSELDEVYKLGLRGVPLV